MALLNYPQATIGIIGGSGLYAMNALTDTREISLETPFGKPSDTLLYGQINGVSVVFLARHGRHHHLLPSEVPYRANIYAMKQLGVQYLLSVSAVGSLQEYARPLDLVIPDQFIDRTRNRESTFFGNGIVAHIAFAEPVCRELSKLVAQVAEGLNLGRIKVHRGGAYLCMEGPAFSTKAESFLYRSWGAKVIGMTNLPEAKLAREAEIAYATLAMVTDFDCWHEEHTSVSVDLVVANLQKNANNAQKVIQGVIERIAKQPPESTAHSALETAILTRLADVPPETLSRLKPLLQKYL